MRRVPALDGVRGLAILLVIACHYFPQVADGGRIGVDLFFVLSGYLITSILLAEHDRRGRVSLGTFYSRRIRRLVPALLGLLVPLALLTIAFDHRRADLIGLAAAAGYGLNIVMAGGLLNPLVGHLWSLSAEEQFYLVWPLLLIALLRLRVPRAWIIGALGVLLAAALAWRVELYMHGASFARLTYAPDVHSDGLIAGCMAALAGDRLLRWAGAQPWVPAVGFAGMVALTVVVVPFPLLSLGRTVVLPSAVALLSAALVVGAPGLGRRGLGRVLTHPALQRIGLISYALYLWHLPVFLALRPVLGPWAPLVALPLSYLIAAASWRWIEQPFKRARLRGYVDEVEGPVAGPVSVLVNP